MIKLCSYSMHTFLFFYSALLQIHSHPSVIHLLLDNGADVNLLDDYGISTLNACYHVLYANVPQVYLLYTVL